ncbi:hypothetical protein SARC_00479 [Sphaeroforma arctica JP610]|uniref:Pentacotripeptide-repeat region of PRORP domain-containing protein n=1 Tax=Sphaeroforma arctica JP610 TaxID=667725 RepID=A0A0L0GED3_9EUKA|nr:hypothetical protein SARC_00479 [Sphaeroforma arctica JP610]KNC87387.1 hypothetical protein SARC_00479 [Sphaeroforma arctica JP610]|eukprot:XP_014161289.1 hypothetical protein SARC_00479 [Sphaeroforma arctica JP610]
MFNRCSRIHDQGLPFAEIGRRLYSSKLDHSSASNHQSPHKSDLTTEKLLTRRDIDYKLRTWEGVSESVSYKRAHDRDKEYIRSQEPSGAGGVQGDDLSNHFPHSTKRKTNTSKRKVNTQGTNWVIVGGKVVRRNERPPEKDQWKNAIHLIKRGLKQNNGAVTDVHCAFVMDLCKKEKRFVECWEVFQAAMQHRLPVNERMCVLATKSLKYTSQVECIAEVVHAMSGYPLYDRKRPLQVLHSPLEPDEMICVLGRCGRVDDALKVWSAYCGNASAVDLTARSRVFVMVHAAGSVSGVEVKESVVSSGAVCSTQIRGAKITGGKSTGKGKVTFASMGNALLAGMVPDRPHEALRFYKNELASNPAYTHDLSTVNALLSAYAHVGDFESGAHLFRMLEHTFVPANPAARSSPIHRSSLFHGHNGRIRRSLEADTLNGLHTEQPIVVDPKQTMGNIHIPDHPYPTAQSTQTLRLAPKRDTYHKMLRLCCATGHYDAMADVVLGMWHSKPQSDLRPNSETIAVGVDALTRSGEWKRALVFFETLSASSTLEQSTRSYNTLMHAYGSGGVLKKLPQVLQKMREHGVKRDVVTYNTAISAYARAGCFDEAVQMFCAGQRDGTSMGAISYTGVIDAANSSGRYTEALRWFDEMRGRKLKLNATAYTSALTACVGGGRQARAVDVFGEMRANDVRPSEDGYVAIFNAFTQLDMWQEVIRIIDRFQVTEKVNWGSVRTLSTNNGDLKASISGTKLAEYGYIREPNAKSHRLTGYVGTTAEELAPGIKVYNAALTALYEMGQWRHALRIFYTLTQSNTDTQQLRESEFTTEIVRGGTRKSFMGSPKPDIATYNISLLLLSMGGRPHEAMRVFKSLSECEYFFNYTPDVQAGLSADRRVDTGPRISRASHVDTQNTRLPQRDGITYHNIIQVLSEHGHLDSLRLIMNDYHKFQSANNTGGDVRGLTGEQHSNVYGHSTGSESAEISHHSLHNNGHTRADTSPNSETDVSFESAMSKINAMMGEHGKPIAGTPQAGSKSRTPESRRVGVVSQRSFSNLIDRSSVSFCLYDGRELDRLPKRSASTKPLIKHCGRSFHTSRGRPPWSNQFAISPPRPIIFDGQLRCKMGFASCRSFSAFTVQQAVYSRPNTWQTYFHVAKNSHLHSATVNFSPFRFITYRGNYTDAKNLDSLPPAVKVIHTYSPSSTTIRKSAAKRKAYPVVAAKQSSPDTTNYNATEVSSIISKTRDTHVSFLPESSTTGTANNLAQRIVLSDSARYRHSRLNPVPPPTSEVQQSPSHEPIGSNTKRTSHLPLHQQPINISSLEDLDTALSRALANYKYSWQEGVRRAVQVNDSAVSLGKPSAKLRRAQKYLSSANKNAVSVGTSHYDQLLSICMHERHIPTALTVLNEMQAIANDNNNVEGSGQRLLSPTAYQVKMHICDRKGNSKEAVQTLREYLSAYGTHKAVSSTTDYDGGSAILLERTGQEFCGLANTLVASTDFMSQYALKTCARTGDWNKIEQVLVLAKGAMSGRPPYSAVDRFGVQTQATGRMSIQSRGASQSEGRARTCATTSQDVPALDFDALCQLGLREILAQAAPKSGRLKGKTNVVTPVQQRLMSMLDYLYEHKMCVFRVELNINSINVQVVDAMSKDDTTKVASTIVVEGARAAAPATTKLSGSERKHSGSIQGRRQVPTANGVESLSNAKPVALWPTIAQSNEQSRRLLMCISHIRPTDRSPATQLAFIHVCASLGSRLEGIDALKVYLQRFRSRTDKLCARERLEDQQAFSKMMRVCAQQGNGAHARDILSMCDRYLRIHAVSRLWETSRGDRSSGDSCANDTDRHIGVLKNQVCRGKTDEDSVSTNISIVSSVSANPDEHTRVRTEGTNMYSQRLAYHFSRHDLMYQGVVDGMRTYKYLKKRTWRNLSFSATLLTTLLSESHDTTLGDTAEQLIESVVLESLRVGAFNDVAGICKSMNQSNLSTRIVCMWLEIFIKGTASYKEVSDIKHHTASNTHSQTMKSATLRPKESILADLRHILDIGMQQRCLTSGNSNDVSHQAKLFDTMINSCAAIGDYKLAESAFLLQVRYGIKPGGKTSQMVHKFITSKSQKADSQSQLGTMFRCVKLLTDDSVAIVDIGTANSHLLKMVRNRQIQMSRYLIERILPVLNISPDRSTYDMYFRALEKGSKWQTIVELYPKFQEMIMKNFRTNGGRAADTSYHTDGVHHSDGAYMNALKAQVKLGKSVDVLDIVNDVYRAKVMPTAQLLYVAAANCAQRRGACAALSLCERMQDAHFEVVEPVWKKVMAALSDAGLSDEVSVMIRVGSLEVYRQQGVPLKKSAKRYAQVYRKGREEYEDLTIEMGLPKDVL